MGESINKVHFINPVILPILLALSRGIRRSSLDLAVCIVVEVNNRSRGASVTAFGLYWIT